MASNDVPSSSVTEPTIDIADDDVVDKLLASSATPTQGSKTNNKKDNTNDKEALQGLLSSKIAELENGTAKEDEEERKIGECPYSLCLFSLP